MKLITVHCADRKDFNLQYEVCCVLSNKEYRHCHNNKEFQAMMKNKYYNNNNSDVFLWADWYGKLR